MPFDLRHAPRAAALAAALTSAWSALAADAGPPVVTVPEKQVATQFGASDAAACPAHGVAGTVLDAIDRAARDAKQQLPADGRLCAMADVLLGWKGDDLPPQDVLRFLSRSVGLLGSPQQITLTTLGTEDPRDIARSLSSSLLEVAGKAVGPRFGLATRRLGRSSTRVVLLLADVPYALSPLPRQLPPGGTARLAGTLLGEFEAPSLVVSDAAGKVTEPPQEPGKAFQAELRCGERPGRILVELRARRGGELRKLAGIPVACGGPPLPNSMPLAAEAWPADAAAQVRLIFDGVNAERVGAGLKALAWEPALATVAQALTVDLADEQLKGAGSGVSVTDRLAQVEMGSPLVLQNPGQSLSARLASEGFLESAVHRANIMNPDVNAGGVGLVERTGPDGRPAVFVTELFVQVLPVLDPAKVRDDVRAAVLEKRAAAKVAPVASDPFLEEVAQSYAVAMAAAAGKLSDAKSEALTQGLAKKYKKINLVPGAKSDPLSFAAEPTLLGDVGKGLGVGTARGGHPVLGKNAVYVVVITATKR